MDDINEYVKFYNQNYSGKSFYFFYMMDYHVALVDSNISLDILSDKKHPEYKKHKKRAKDGEMELLNNCRSTLKSSEYRIMQMFLKILVV